MRFIGVTAKGMTRPALATTAFQSFLLVLLLQVVNAAIPEAVLLASRHEAVLHGESVEGLSAGSAGQQPWWKSCSGCKDACGIWAQAPDHLQMSSDITGVDAERFGSRRPEETAVYIKARGKPFAAWW